MAVETPHFNLPFSLDGHNQVEQDSPDDVAHCVAAILLYRVDYLMALPEFGITDPVFRQGGPNIDEIAAAIAEFEPRAAAEIDDISAILRAAGSIDAAVSAIRIALGL